MLIFTADVVANVVPSFPLYGGGEVRHVRHLDVLDDCVGLLFPESNS